MIGVGSRVVSPGERLFRPLNNLMLFTSTLTHTFVSMGLSQQVVGPTTFHTIQSDVAEWQMLLPGFGPLEDAIRGAPERKFELVVRAANMIHSIYEPMADVPGYIGNVAVPLYLFHFVTCQDWLYANGHGATNKWPMVLDFARVVRNAAAHGGRLKIENANARPVTWGPLTYSPADNGKTVIGTDLFFGDLVALMIQADDATVALGAPP